MLLQEEELPEPDTSETLEALASRVGKAIVAEALVSERPVSPILPKQVAEEGSVGSLDGESAESADAPPGSGA